MRKSKFSEPDPRDPESSRSRTAVMKYGGHKTLESFSNYIHPTDEGRIVSMQALDNVDGILTAQGSVDGVRSNESVKKRSRKPLQNKQVAV
jgi:hypothetical protein